MSINPISIFTSAANTYNRYTSAAYSPLFSGSRSALADLFTPSSRFINSYSAAMNDNVTLQGASSYYSVQESVNSEIHDATSQMKSLAIQAQDPLLNDEDRALLDQEFQSLKAQVNSYEDFSYNGNGIYDNTVSVSQSSGNTLEFEATEFSNLAVDDSLSIDTAANAEAAISNIDDTIENIDSAQVNVASNLDKISNTMDQNLNSAVFAAELESATMLASLPSFLDSLSQAQSTGLVNAFTYNQSVSSNRSVLSSLLYAK